MPDYAYPPTSRPPTRAKKQVQLLANGDLRITANQICWPEQTKAALGAKYEPIGLNKPKKDGVSFPTIASAKLDIAGVKGDTKADPKATGATLSVKLPAGKTKLKAWFSDADGKDLCGAFYVTVKRK